MLKALTANRLIDGEVVFWSGEAWVERFGQARLFDAEDAAEAAEAHAKAEIARLIDPYLIEVAPVDGGFAPVSYRERLRALGPTNKPDHGKQALGGADVEALTHAHGAARSKGRVDLIRRK
jgi:sulfite reductase (NADPH) hemoprotein beta-component